MLFVCIEKIVSVGSPPSLDTAVIEIGPAAGNLTRALLGRGYSKILLIEKDTRFQPILKVVNKVFVYIALSCVNVAIGRLCGRKNTN